MTFQCANDLFQLNIYFYSIIVLSRCRRCYSRTRFLLSIELTVLTFVSFYIFFSFLFIFYCTILYLLWLWFKRTYNYHSWRCSFNFSRWFVAFFWARALSFISLGATNRVWTSDMRSARSIAANTFINSGWFSQHAHEMASTVIRLKTVSFIWVVLWHLK